MLLSEDMTEWSVSIKKYVRNISVNKSVHTDVRKSVQKDRNSGSGRLFTNTVSHKMVRCAVEEAGRCNAEIIRCHTSSKNALEDILETACAAV